MQRQTNRRVRYELTLWCLILQGTLPFQYDFISYKGSLVRKQAPWNLSSPPLHITLAVEQV